MGTNRGCYLRMKSINEFVICISMLNRVCLLWSDNTKCVWLHTNHVCQDWSRSVFMIRDFVVALCRNVFSCVVWAHWTASR